MGLACAMGQLEEQLAIGLRERPPGAVTVVNKGRPRTGPGNGRSEGLGTVLRTEHTTACRPIEVRGEDVLGHFF